MLKTDRPVSTTRPLMNLLTHRNAGTASGSTKLTSTVNPIATMLAALTKKNASCRRARSAGQSRPRAANMFLLYHRAAPKSTRAAPMKCRIFLFRRLSPGLIPPRRYGKISRSNPARGGTTVSELLL